MSPGSRYTRFVYGELEQQPILTTPFYVIENREDAGDATVCACVPVHCDFWGFTLFCAVRSMYCRVVIIVISQAMLSRRIINP